MKRTTLLAAAWMVSASVLAGCGDEDHGLSDEAAAVLGPRVEAIRAAVAAGDRAVAQAEASRVRLTLDELRTAGAVDEAEASTVLEALSDVERKLSLLPETTTTTTTTVTAPTAITTATTTATTTTPVDQGGDDKGRGKKKARGNGGG